MSRRYREAKANNRERVAMQRLRVHKAKPWALARYDANGNLVKALPGITKA